MDQVAATRAVIEAAKRWRDGEISSLDLATAIEALASATSPDLDAKIAEKLPCQYKTTHCLEVDGVWVHNSDCPSYYRSAVRDLIVALLVEERRNASVYLDEMTDPYQRAVKVGYDQAREQAAQIANNCCMEYARDIRAMEPQK